MKRILIVGGVAGGASAAARARFATEARADDAPPAKFPGGTLKSTPEAIGHMMDEMFAPVAAQFARDVQDAHRRPA